MGASASKGEYAYSVVPGGDGFLSTKNGTPRHTNSDLHADDDEVQNVESVVQFSCSMYYCEESEGEMTIDILRLGSSSGEAVASYTTADGSAKAGWKYEAQAGSVKFAPGETIKHISVALLQDENWDATLEFVVVLTGVTGATLGKYLNTCRVKVIDSDVFPTNKYEPQLRALQEDDIPGFGLMQEYFKMNLKNKQICVDSFKQVAWDQVKGWYFILTLYLQMYLVDVVLNPKYGDDLLAGKESGEHAEGRLLLQSIHAGARLLGRALGEEEGSKEGSESEEWLPYDKLLVPHHRRDTAIIIALLYILPFGLLHLIDLRKCHLCIPGAVRKILQANLLRRFLNYREDMRGLLLDSSEITMAMVRDVVDVVDFGYMKALEALRIVGKLSCALIFILAENKYGVIPLIIYPIVLGCFLVCRESKTLRHTVLKAEKQDHLVSAVNDAIVNYRLLADFHLRPVIVDTYEERIDAYHDQESTFSAVITNNTYLAPWLTTITIGGYIIVGAYEAAAFGGPLSLGTFLATINVFKEIGAEITRIYVVCSEIQRAVGPLKKICHLLNQDTDLRDCLRVNRMRRLVGETKRQQMRMSNASLFAADEVDIEVRNLSFQYVSDAAPVLSGVSIRFNQGRLFSFVGPPHEGKATLLRLFGHMLLPKEGCGEIFVPPHLRILHVSNGGALLHTGTFLENVVLHDNLASIGGKERVLKICRRLGFSPYLMRELENVDGSTGSTASQQRSDSRHTLNWPAHISGTDHARLTMARVFIKNPECLVMHKPLESFNDAEAKRITRMLRAHVDERGLELCVRGRKFRRPRTVFMSSATLAALNEADQVYRISAEGVWPIDKDKVDERLLL